MRFSLSVAVPVRQSDASFPAGLPRNSRRECRRTDAPWHTGDIDRCSACRGGACLALLRRTPFGHLHQPGGGRRGLGCLAPAARSHRQRDHRSMDTGVDGLPGGPRRSRPFGRWRALLGRIARDLCARLRRGHRHGGARGNGRRRLRRHAPSGPMVLRSLHRDGHRWRRQHRAGGGAGLHAGLDPRRLDRRGHGGGARVGKSSAAESLEQSAALVRHCRLVAARVEAAAAARLRAPRGGVHLRDRADRVANGGSGRRPARVVGRCWIGGCRSHRGSRCCRLHSSTSCCGPHWRGGRNPPTTPSAARRASPTPPRAPTPAFASGPTRSHSSRAIHGRAWASANSISRGR